MMVQFLFKSIHLFNLNHQQIQKQRHSTTIIFFIKKTDKLYFSQKNVSCYYTPYYFLYDVITVR